jgi:hypothetical protein
VTGGVLYANDIRANKLSAFSSELGNVNISEAYIGTLTVGTSNIDPGAITNIVFAESGGGPNTIDLYVTANHGQNSPKIKVEFRGKIQAAAGNTLQTFASLRDDTGGVDIDSVPVVTTGNYGDVVMWSKLFTPPSSRTQTTFRARFAGVPNSNWSMLELVAYTFKR